MNLADIKVPPEDIELDLMLEGVFQRYGFDFRDYARPSLKRRINDLLSTEGLTTVSELQNRILRDADCMERLLLALSVHYTSMFRDPGFYRAFRQKVVPLLRTYPFVRIWHAGCSTGEEVYSLAVLLEEERLYNKCRIYATDMNEHVIQLAKAGIYPLKRMQEYTKNYLDAGGKASFSEYYTADRGSAIMRSSLKENIVFARHNLAMEDSFNEFNAILCRNVMIYFNEKLHRRVLGLFAKSLASFGILALGKRESLGSIGDCQAGFQPIDENEKIYRRVG